MMYPYWEHMEFKRGRLSGRVRCASTGELLDGAVVKLKATYWKVDVDYPILFEAARTDSEGYFESSTVPVGSYYVFAERPGYVSRASLIPRRHDLYGPLDYLCVARAMLDLDSYLGRVTVAEGQESYVELSLQPGGSISGAICWSDGSPAKRNEIGLWRLDEVGSHRAYTARTAEGLRLRREHDFYLTDDNGKFLLADVHEGFYILCARVPRFLPYERPNSVPGPPIVNCFSSFIWTGNEPHQSRAMPFEVTSGLDTVVNLRLPMLEQDPIPLLPYDPPSIPEIFRRPKDPHPDSVTAPDGSR